jgi:hypothetical protein
MDIKINNKIYHVLTTEYTKINHIEYTNLKLYNELGHHERIIGLLNMLSKIVSFPMIYFFHTTHGGFIPINYYLLHRSTIYLIDTTEEHENNIKQNLIQKSYKEIYKEINEYYKMNSRKFSSFFVYKLYP